MPTPSSPSSATPASPSSFTGQASATQRAANVWQLAMGQGTVNQISPLAFYTRATDQKGHGERLSFKVPPEMMAQIQRLVSDADFPDYTMPADVARDAIAHLLDMRSKQSANMELRESVQKRLAQLTYAEFTQRMQDDVTFWTEITEKTRGALTASAQEGAWDQVWEFLRCAEEMADPVPEPWRQKMFELIEEWRVKVPEKHRSPLK